jgi:transcriptional regulator with XRE-family HTH domain
MTLRAFLQSRGYSVTATARELGIARTTLHKVMSGERTVSLALAVRIVAWSAGAFQLADLPLSERSRDALRALHARPGALDPPATAPALAPGGAEHAT